MEMELARGTTGAGVGEKRYENKRSRREKRQTLRQAAQKMAAVDMLMLNGRWRDCVQLAECLYTGLLFTVQTLTSDTCRVSAEFPVEGQSGYIASIVTSDTPSCDGSRQPWSIRAAIGQRIDLTLYDFALERDAAPFASTSATAVRTSSRDSVGLPRGEPGTETGRRCRQYGLLEDSRPRKTFVICGGQTRIRQLYTSEGEIVKIWITAGIGPKDLQRFVIQYSGTTLKRQRHQ